MAILQLLICLLVAVTHGLRYNAAYVDYNLNQNQQAIDPLDYSAERPNHTYFPSPTDWRFPFYTLFLDRLANGDPTNDDINGTVYERDTTSNQLRHGGDLQGLVDSLDYIQGMGMKVNRSSLLSVLEKTRHSPELRVFTLPEPPSSTCRGVWTHTRLALPPYLPMPTRAFLPTPML